MDEVPLMVRSLGRAPCNVIAIGVSTRQDSEPATRLPRTLKPCALISIPRASSAMMSWDVSGTVTSPSVPFMDDLRTTDAPSGRMTSPLVGIIDSGQVEASCQSSNPARSWGQSTKEESGKMHKVCVVRWRLMLQFCHYIRV